jgi:lipopolysaccharide transport system permease protein
MAVPLPDSSTPDSEFEIVIRPDRSWLRLNPAEIYHYRDLLGLMIRRDFLSKYRQTILGPIWFIIQPLVMTVVFTFVFHRAIGVPTDGAPPFLFYLSGQLGWNYFSTVLSGTGNTFIANGNLFGKVYFPRLIVPFSTAISAATTVAIQLVTLLVVLAWFHFFTPAGAVIHTQWSVLLVPLLLLQIGVFAVGVGLMLSAATAKYRDLQHMLTFLVQLWMYATPVIYPLSQIPERWRWIAVANPLTSVVESIRHSFLGTPAPEPRYIITSVFVALAVFFAGILAFQRAERTFVDKI